MNILVTGGASGLGGSIVKKLASNRANTIYFTFSKAEDSAQLIQSQFENTKAIKLDFTNGTSLSEACKLFSEYSIEALINNAYVGPLEKNYFHKNPLSIYSSGFNNNIIPVIQLTQAAISYFRKKKFGRIITVLSSAIIGKPQLGSSAYIAEKQYLLSLTKSWAIENAAFNITSNCVSPDFMLTAIHKDIDERIVENIINNSPLKKILTTEEVSESIEFLLYASPQINGVNIPINAGNYIL